jgi:hypothetical protein
LTYPPTQDVEEERGAFDVQEVPEVSRSTRRFFSVLLIVIFLKPLGGALVRVFVGVLFVAGGILFLEFA